MVQAEVNGWVHTAVEECQAARDDEPVVLPWLSFTAELSSCEMWNNHDGFKNIEGEPGHHKGQYDAEDHLQGVFPARVGSRVSSSSAVLIEVHDDGAIAEHNDKDRKDEGD